MGSAIVPYRSSLPASAPGRGLVSYLTSRRNLTGSALALLVAGLVLAAPVGSPGILPSAALDVLGEELDVLDAEMRQVAEVVHRTDMDRLLAHKRFLIDRFHREEASG